MLCFCFQMWGFFFCLLFCWMVKRWLQCYQICKIQFLKYLFLGIKKVKGIPADTASLQTSLCAQCPGPFFKKSKRSLLELPSTTPTPSQTLYLVFFFFPPLKVVMWTVKFESCCPRSVVSLLFQLGTADSASLAHLTCRLWKWWDLIAALKLPLSLRKDVGA